MVGFSTLAPGVKQVDRTAHLFHHGSRQRAHTSSLSFEVSLDAICDFRSSAVAINSSGSIC